MEECGNWLICGGCLSFIPGDIPDYLKVWSQADVGDQLQEFMWSLQWLAGRQLTLDHCKLDKINSKPRH